MNQKTSGFICALLFLSSALTAGAALRTDSAIVRGIQYDAAADSAALAAARPVPTLSSVAVSFDVCGAGMALFGKYGQYEAALRIGLHGKFFPICEVGVGSSNHTDETTALHYRVNAPYFRLGLDYNIANNPRDLGRIYVGARYGFSTFKYDVGGPDLVDPYYGITTPYRFNGVGSNAHWCEICAGVEAKVWKILRLGWTARFKFLFHDKVSSLGHAWYIPGFGKQGGTCLGGNFYVAFDI